MFRDDNLNHTLTRVIRNTKLAGTYNSIVKEDIKSPKQPQLDNRKLSSMLHRRRGTVLEKTTTKEEDEDAEELKEVKHLPKAKIVEATQQLF